MKAFVEEAVEVDVHHAARLRVQQDVLAMSVAQPHEVTQHAPERLRSI